MHIYSFNYLQCSKIVVKLSLIGQVAYYVLCIVAYSHQCLGIIKSHNCATN